jgi:hypothetical protein
LKAAWFFFISETYCLCSIDDKHEEILREPGAYCSNQCKNSSATKSILAAAK